jgi:hypothetical protein
MLKKMMIAGLIAAPMLWAAPALAQRTGVLLIYGNDKCPTNENGDEIVVCQRLDESERFRIPKNIREAEVRPQATESWAVRQQDALTTGGTGTNSCSAVGANGATGCFVRQATEARQEAKKRKEEAENLPLP